MDQGEAQDPEGVFVLSVPHGDKVYNYFRAGTLAQRAAFPNVRLSDDRQEALAQAQQLARIATDPGAAALYRLVGPLLKTARRRARDLGAPFELSETETFEILRRQDGRCALSGLAFIAQGPHEPASPFAAMLEPIAPDKGFVAGNLQAVCAAASTMLRAWGPATLLTVSQAVARQARSRR